MMAWYSIKLVTVNEVTLIGYILKEKTFLVEKKRKRNKNEQDS